MIMPFKRLLDRHVDKQGIKGCGACADKDDSFNLVLCSVQTLWTEGPVAVLFYYN